jgi:porin-like protein
MKMVKSLLLGTAAGFVAVAGAQAADMPVKAAVQYVKICNLYGDGFYYIPGTNICLKLGGYARAQIYGYTGQNATAGPFFATNINNDRGPAGGFNLNGVGFGQSDFTFRTRAVITVDTREQTDYGVLRTYFLFGHTGDSPNPEGLYANRGFIQWAGFTFGLAQSFFDFYSDPAVSYLANLTEDTGDGGWRVAAFTANFGNGITSTLSIEEPRRIGITNAALAGQVTGSFNPNSLNIRSQFNDPFLVGAIVPQATGQIKAPDIVYNTRLDQQWGAIMLGGAVTDVTATYYGANATSAGTGLTSCAPPGFNAVTDANVGGVAGGGSGVGSIQCGHPADKLGWVATGGLRFNVPGGSYFQMQGSYTQGALRYIAHTQYPFGSAARFGVGNTVGLGWLMDGIYGSSGEIELTRAWGIYASYEQIWNPKWKTSIYGGWTAVSYDDNAKALIAAATCGNQAGAGNFLPAVFNTTAIANFPTQQSGSITNVTNCDPNWQLGWIGTRTQWNITSQFYMGVDVIYTKMYSGFKGLGVFRSPGTGPGSERPAGVYAIEDQDNLAVTFRVHRDFVL